MNMEKRSLWEMYTPYGIYTLIGNYQEVTVVSILLTQGEYKIKEAFSQSQRNVPMLSSGDYENWAVENFNMSIDDIVKNTDKIALSEVLNSVIKANKYQRMKFEEQMKIMITPEEKEKYKIEWNEENDSGIHGITEQAWLLSGYFKNSKNASQIFV